MKHNSPIPRLVLNEQICKANIRRMAEKAQKNGLTFKPHMKTHQSATIGEWFRKEGVKSITVSSLKMASFFAKNGWDDITIAFPANFLQSADLNRLTDDISLTLLFDNPVAVEKIDEQLQHPINAYIEIDTGSNRTGLKVSQTQKIEDLINAIQKSNNITWIGFYSHPGHSYAARSKKEILSIFEDVKGQISNLKNKFSNQSNTFEVCIGDTPCCSAASTFEGIDAISPGNFVFYDVMQYHIGSCRPSDIAVAVECPVVGKYPERNELAIHGGAIHFSKESFTSDSKSHFGLLATKKENHWHINPDCYVRKLSQEHGIVSCTKTVFNNYNIGDTLTILPVHSCLTAHLMGKYYSLQTGNTIEHLSSIS